MAVQPISIPQTLARVLDQAGDKSGVDFGYLLQTAMRESSLNPAARASTSTAVGLFQFLEGTWLEVMKLEGPRLGYTEYADQIERTAGGEYVIPDRALRGEILKLREDPQIAADLAAAFTRRNGEYLQEKFGRMPSPGELYIAHFMGASGAEQLFRAGLQNPDQIAATLFPRQAAANRPIFYEQGEPRTIREVYRSLVAKHGDGAPQAAFTAQQVSSEAALANTPPAAAASPQAPDAVPSRFAADPAEMSFTALFSPIPEGRFTSPVALPEEPPRSRFFVDLYGE